MDDVSALQNKVHRWSIGTLAIRQIQEKADAFFIPLEVPPRQVTRSMLSATKSPPPPPSTKPKWEPHAADNQPKPQPQPLRHFTRSLLLVKDKQPTAASADNQDEPPAAASAADKDELGTTTCSSTGSPEHSPNLKEASGSKAARPEEVPSNLRELLTTGLLDSQCVKYIKKGKLTRLPYSLAWQELQTDPPAGVPCASVDIYSFFRLVSDFAEEVGSGVSMAPRRCKCGW